MKTTMNFRSIALIAALGAALTLPLLAEAGPGMGGGMGGGGMGPGAGPGAHGGRGMRFNQNNTAGWTLMSADERSAMQTRMHAVKTVEECQVLQTEHRGLMETRAKEKGMTLPAPRQDGCQRMQARGFSK